MQLDRRTLLTVILLALSVGILIAAGFWYIDTLSIYKIIEMNMDMYIGKIVGFNVDTDAVHFGIVPAGGTSIRKIVLKAGPYKSRVDFEYIGDISPFVYVSDNAVILQPNENRTVQIMAEVPEEMNVSKVLYKNGTLRIIFRKV